MKNSWPSRKCNAIRPSRKEDGNCCAGGIGIGIGRHIVLERGTCRTVLQQFIMLIQCLDALIHSYLSSILAQAFKTTVGSD